MNVLHMKKGTGEGSYAKNSKVQSIIISMTKHVVEEAIAKTLQSADDVPDTLGVADLGCGSGPNTLSVMSAIIKAVHTRCSEIGCRLPELRMSLNDLPDNDFNSVFSVLEPGFYREMMVEKELCFISGVPGSFYGRLFPRNSLHFVYSSSSVHWLSQVPPCLQIGKNNHPTIVNKGSVYINKTSSKGVVQSYVEQFQNDFKVFLESRSAEVVSGGRMVLSLYGRMSPQHTDEMNENAIFELLTQALMTLVSKGIVEEEKVDSFNMPIYSPSADELESAIHEEGSFSIEHLDSFVVGWDQDPAPVGNAAGFNLSAKTVPKITFGQRMVTILRSIVEALLESQFGMEVVNDIATTAALILDENPAKYRLNYVNIVVSLVRK